MTSFSELRRDVMDLFEKILPLLADPRPGQKWTGRLELQGIIERIETWMDRHGGDFEAIELRNYFRSLPHARFTFDECVAALKEETARWTGRRP